MTNTNKANKASNAAAKAAKVAAKAAKVAAMQHGDATAGETASLQDQLQELVFQALRDVAGYGDSHTERRAYVGALKAGDPDTFGAWSAGQHALNARRVVGEWLTDHASRGVTAVDMTPEQRQAATVGAVRAATSLLNGTVTGRAYSVTEVMALASRADHATGLLDVLASEIDANRKATRKGGEPVTTHAPTPDSRARAAIALLAAVVPDVQAGKVSPDLAMVLANYGFALADAVTTVSVGK